LLLFGAHALLAFTVLLIAAVGCLPTQVIQLAVVHMALYSDNAGGIAEMADFKEVRERTDKLDGGW